MISFLCEIGGTVGDIEAMPFLEAIRQLGNDLPRGSAVYIHLTLDAVHPGGRRAQDQANAAFRQGTPLDRHSARYTVRYVPIARFRNQNGANFRFSAMCARRRVIQALDVDTIYDVPMAYHKEGLDLEVLAAFGIDPAPKPRMERWDEVSQRIHNPEGEVTIAIVGKYTGLKDAYKSLIEALHHGGMANKVKVNLDWIELEIFEQEDPAPYLQKVHGILVPGGFGERGSEGKILAAKFAREKKVPYFGICFGMQMAVIEAARSLAGVDKASSSEFGPTSEPVVGLMTEWLKGNMLEKRAQSGDLGGTMRLGAYEALLKSGTRIADIYGTTDISERHRHRYEVNIDYKDRLEDCGLVFSGMSPDGVLPETIEYPDHPWFIGVQYHPGIEVTAVRATSAICFVHQRSNGAKQLV